MPIGPRVLAPEDLAPGGEVSGETLSIANWPAVGVGGDVAPLHVHHADDEAWYVIEGALRFRLGDDELIARAGTTVLVPAGIPHTFGNAGPEPSRYLVVMPARLRQLIRRLHEVTREEHAEVYAAYESELLE